MIQDKSTIQQILGALIKHPQYLSQSDKYILTVSDFTTKFEKCLFNAIENLYENGLNKIQIIDIENFFENDPISKDIFEKNNGIEFLQDLDVYTDENNFEYYYNKLKKINLLRDYQKIGIDISSFYAEDLTDPKSFEINQKFELLTVSEIAAQVKKRLLNIEGKYLKNDVTEVESASENIETLIQSFYDHADIGLPLQGIYFNEILNGARKGTLCIRSAGSGTGKTRQAVGDACYLAFPIRYNSQTCEWEQTGNSEKILFIATEKDFNEIRKMILAYLTDINESRFRYGDFSDREKKIIEQAVVLLKEYEDNFYIVRMPNPTIELVKHIIRENCLTKDISYVFYDYIFIGPSLLNEFKGFNLRNDEVLLMFATALKDLSVELNVFVMTSTQVNANADDNKNIRNESSLAGGRSTINKADYGLIMARPTKEELETLEPLIVKFKEPNVVIDVFKVRSGEWTQVRIWSYVNLGTLKKEDLFVTNSRLEPIDNFTANFNYLIPKLDEEQEKKANKIIAKLNY